MQLATLDTILNILKLFARKYSRQEFLNFVADYIQNVTDCRRVGIRTLNLQGDIYYEAQVGYEREFWLCENFLSIHQHDCVCTRVIMGVPTSTDLPVMSAGGSVYVNDTNGVLDDLKEEDRLKYRGTCLENGFCSVAVVPIVDENNILGAIHIADERKDMVPYDTVFWVESIGRIIGEIISTYNSQGCPKEDNNIAKVLDTLFSDVDVMCYVSDPRTHEIVYANITLQKLYNRKIVGGKCFKVLFGLDKPCSTCANDFITSLREPYRWEGHRHGQEVRVVSRLIRWPDGRDLRLDMSMNISESKQIQLELSKYKLFVENAKDIMLYIDLEGNVLEANKAAVLAYGYTPEEFRTLTIREIRSADEEALTTSQMKDAYLHGIYFQALHRRKDGSTFPVEVNSQGAVIGTQKVLLSVIRDITDRKRIESQLNHLATHDLLTDIPNRYSLEETLQGVIKSLSKERTSALLLLDIDNFNNINESFGHKAGDQVLVSVAERLRGVLRSNAILARIGGDEFAVIIEDINIADAKRAASKLLAALSDEAFRFSFNSVSFNISASIGLTSFDNSAGYQSVLANAGVALFSAKESGKNRMVALTTPEEIEISSKTSTMLMEIRSALTTDRFTLFYQPVFHRSVGILHHEALIRMYSAEGELLPPAAFLPIAEKFGLISAIDRWVVKSCIRSLQEDTEVSIFINISAVSIGDDELLAYITSIILESGVSPERIGFEITETTAIRDLKQAEGWIRSLKDIGCKIALDDFGAGFSSFTYLQELPFDYLKIDGSFVRDVDKNHNRRALVQAINSISHALGKVTVAEYVENEEVWEILKEMNIDCGQGYYLGKPRPHLY